MGPSNSKKTADHLIQWLRQYSTTHLDPYLADEQRNFPPHVFLDLGNQGFFGLHVSRQYGGLELNTVDILRVIEQLAAIDLTLTTLIIESIQGAHTLEHYATDSMKSRYLSQLANGRIFTAGAMTESAAGSNPRAIKSTATPNHQNGWTLCGSKRWVGMGASAEVIAMYVHEYDQHNQWIGMSSFLVPKDAPGLQIGPESPTMGLRGFAKHSLYMNQIHVSSEQRLGKPGCGMEVAQDNMMFIRLCLAAASLGAMKKCAQLLVRYAERRHIATGKLIDNPVILLRISEMTAMIDALSYFITGIANYHDKPETHLPEETFVIAKILGSECLNWAVDTLVQTLGARGYEETNGVAKLFRDARVFRIFEGPTEALNMYIGSRVLTKNVHIETFIDETLSQHDLFAEIKLSIKTLQRHYQHDKSDLFKKAFSLQYWTQSVVGEIMSYGFLTVLLNHLKQNNASKELDRAITWANQHYADIVRKAFRSSPAEKVLLQATQAHALVSNYIDSIGNLESPRAMVDNTIDSLLRHHQKWEYDKNTYSPEHEFDFEHDFLSNFSESERSERSAPVVTEMDRQQLLHTWNNAEHKKTSNLRCIHLLFEEQVTRSPNAVAITFYEQKITYAELNAQANRIAHHLIQSGIKVGDLVAIYMTRSIDMIAGLLGILKSGAAYLPLDHYYPQKSLAFMYQNSGARFLLTQKAQYDQTLFATNKIFCIEDILTSSDNTSNPYIKELSPNSLCYVIYTSGSTNHPKGVMLPHRALTNLIRWHIEKIDQPRTVLQFTTLNFDMSSLEIFSAFCSGGQLIMLNEKDRVDLLALSHIIKQYQVQTLILSVPFLKSLTNASLDKKYFSSLREIIIAGEQLLLTPSVTAFFSQLSACRLFNYYGPSETHVVTAYDFPENTAEWPEYPPIGQAINHTKILILDEEQQLVPIGVAGEIYVGGINLAQGYINHPTLTQEKFVIDPWGETPNDKLYRTGDFGKYQSDGQLIFLGRKDDQIKIRGFRIELQEIEMHILKYPGIQEAVVIAKPDMYSNKLLEAFIVINDEYHEQLQEAIQQYLKESLPQHMIPIVFNIIDAIPLTASGKINRAALEKHGRTLSSSTRKIIEPKTQTEKAIVAIMEDIFKLHIGVNNSYASIGGNSLLAMEIVSQLQEQFAVEIPAFSLLSDPTIGDTAKRIDYLLAEHNNEGALH